MTKELVPPDPPGRSTRKARGYSTEIRRLRAQGYTFEAIRIALASVGIEVSNRTVQREFSRPADATTQQPSSQGRENQQAPSHTVSVATTDVVGQLPIPQASQRRSGKDIAEEFRRSQSTNPLIRAKEQR